MKLHIKFELDKPLNIPIHYHRDVQGLIYNKMSQYFGELIHDHGYKHDTRTYKLFSFSRLEGDFQFNRQNKTLTFSNQIQLTISSIIPDFLEDLANNFLLCDSVSFFNEHIRPTQATIQEDKIYGSVIHARAASPITSYTTYQRRDGSKFTHYFHPKDLAFQHLVEVGLINKYEAFYNTKLTNDLRVYISPVKVSREDKVVTKYKNTVINAWGGLYRLEGPKELLEFSLATGLGSKNSQGFGMMTLQKEIKNK